MELRALVAVILSMAVLAAYQYFFVPPPSELPIESELAGAPPATLDEVAEEPSLADSSSPAESQGEAPVEATQAALLETQVTIISEDFVTRLTNAGGRIESFVLPAYADESGSELDLVNSVAREIDRLPLEWWVPGDPASTDLLNEALFETTVRGGETTAAGVRPGPGSPVRVEYSWADGTGRSARKEIVLPASGNIVELTVSTRGFNAAVFVSLGAGLDDVGEGIRNAYLAERALAFGVEGLEKWTPSELEASVAVQSPQWVGVESYYFLGAFLLDGLNGQPSNALLSVADAGPAPAPVDAETEEPAAAAAPRLLPSAALATQGLAGPVPIYLGPKKYDYLGAQGHDLHVAVDFGMWGIISRPLLWILNQIHSLVANYGLSIILLTALLRLVFWPLNQKAMTSMRKTQTLQPQMTAIRAKYKGVKDLEKRQKMNEEVMELYKREGVSPLGGCLPMLAQFPILLSFYALLSVAIELRQAPFALWIQDLSRHDPYLVLPLLMGGSMVLQQRLTPVSNNADPQQASMMKMMRWMPVLFTVMFLYVPSGLVLYWLVNSVLGIGQQVYVNKSIDRQVQAEKAARKRGKRQRGTE